MMRAAAQSMEGPRPGARWRRFEVELSVICFALGLIIGLLL
jgi:hypothetical protein